VELEILIVSDATGATAEAVATSALVQFGGAAWHLRRYPFTRTAEQIDEIVGTARENATVVVFTFVSRELSDHLFRRAQEKGLAAFDLLSPMMGIFSAILRDIPSRTPGAFRGQTEDLFKVTEAIHYTLRHDDGAGLSTLHEADLIILGVSRTGKTPTSIYLSCRKLKVANVPIVLDLPLPAEVLRSPATKVGFVMDLERLVTIRGERLDQRRMSAVPGYSDRRSITREAEYCQKIFRSIPGVHTINVTNRSIEEISDWIARHVM
jgi:regulator of PEP synthase PpsR (kinase-PPPase family)